MCNYDWIPTLLSSSVLGIASHSGYFIHGEHHMHSVRLAILLFASPLLMFTVLQAYSHYSFSESLYITTSILFSYLASLTTSILTNRVFFHPLRQFAAPLSAKLTKFSHLIRLLKKFIPERWGDRPDLIRDKSVFITFPPGAYSCIGKQLALMELRVVTARLVTEFDINFAEGKNGTNVLSNTKDLFTMEVAPLMLVLTRR